jgi:hypothetical protein
MTTLVYDKFNMQGFFSLGEMKVSHVSRVLIFTLHRYFYFPFFF